MSDEGITARLEEISRRISDLEREVGVATGLSYGDDVQTRIHRLESALREISSETFSARAIQSKLGHDDQYRQVVKQEERQGCLVMLVMIAVAIITLIVLYYWATGKL